MKTTWRITLSLLILLLFSLWLTACGSAATPEVEATAQAAATATPLAEPTDTPAPPTHTPKPPTATPEPTDTPLPPTDTPEPTNTPKPTPTPKPTNTPKPPTDTPEPTDTPAPATATPVPVPPTDTPAPVISEAEAHFSQGRAFMDEKKWDEAIAEFQAAITLDPEFGAAYEGLGYSYALGDKGLEAAIKALEKYLELVPAASDRAEVEADIQKMKENQASNPLPEPPPGKAIFYFANYSGEQWNVDVGPYFMEVPPNPPGQEYNLVTIVIDPGTYTWQAHSANAGYYITDGSGNRAFEFTVAAGEAYGTSCCR